MTSSIHPVLIIFIGAILVALLKGKWKGLVSVLTPILGLINLISIDRANPDSYVMTMSLMELDLVVDKFDKIGMMFAYLFHFAAIITSIYSLHVRDNMQKYTGLLYAGSAIGAVLAGDLITLFVFWELLAITSVFQIFAKRTKGSSSAGIRYLLMHIFSGLLLLTGSAIIYNATKSLEFRDLDLTSVGPWLIFMAFGIKCGFPLLHTWLTDSYPQATCAGTVYLCCFTTKTAVYAMCRAFPGTEILIYIGAAMAIFPIFYAVIENDLRRTLAFSMINQIGFMMVGIGLGTDTAMNGAVAHAFNDVFFKGLLFMGMGAVLYRTGTINGSQLGGLYKSMPWTTGLTIIGALAISGFPLMCAFVSKSMIMVEAAKAGHTGIWLILLFAAAGVLHHAGIKIPFFAFFAHDSGIRTREAPVSMLIAMGISALACIIIGSFPNQTLYLLLPFGSPENFYQPYDATHVITQLQILFFSVAAFVVLMITKLYPPETPSVNLDFDWTWRKGGKLFYMGADRLLNVTNDKAHRFFIINFIGWIGQFTKSAPSRILVMFMTPIWKVRGLEENALKKKQQSFYEDARLGAFPIGRTAIFAVILLGLLYVL